MRGVTTEREIRDCQNRLKGALIRGLNQEIDLTIRYKGGGSKPYPINHNGVVWFCSHLKLEGRFWNAFGLYPDENGQNNITVEINPPHVGINLGQGQGMFAYDQESSLFLLHGGRIGGGRQGIGKNAFLKWYLQYDHMTDVEVGEGKSKKGILVGNISDEGSFLDDLTAFIKNVWVFKMLATNQTIDSKLADLLSYMQKTGRKTGSPGRKTTAVPTYYRDRIVTELAKMMAKGKCRLCKKKGPFQDRVLELPFLEAHHVKWLSAGGRDSIDNTVALCPNCHRKMHLADKDDVKDDVVVLRRIAKEQTRLLR